MPCRHRLLVFVVLSFAGTLAAAEGVGHAASTLTRSQYIARQDAICRVEVAALKAVPPLSSATLTDLRAGQLAAADFDDLDRYFTALIKAAAWQQTVRQVTAVPLPNGDQLLRRWRAVAVRPDGSVAVRDAARSHDPARLWKAFAAAANNALPYIKLSKQLGFRACGRQAITAP